MIAAAVQTGQPDGAGKIGVWCRVVIAGSFKTSKRQRTKRTRWVLTGPCLRGGKRRSC